MFDVRVYKGQRRDPTVVYIGMHEGGGDEHRSEALDYRSDAEVACDGVFAEHPHLWLVFASVQLGLGTP